MRALPLPALALCVIALPASAQSTASFPEPAGPTAPTAPVASPPVVSPPVYTSTAQPGWGGAAMTAAPVQGTGLGYGGTWESAPAPAPMQMSPPTRDQGAPPGYELEEHTPSTPIVVGSIMLGIPYATGLGIAAAEDFANSSGWLAVPVLGPWLTLASRSNPCETAKDAQEFNSDVGHCVAEPFVRGMLVLDGVLQATGTVVLIVGASSSEKRLVKKQEPRVVAMPAPVGRTGYGVGLLGTF